MVLHDWTLIFLEEWFLLLVVYRVDFSIFVTARTYHAHFYKLTPLSPENVKNRTLPKKRVVLLIIRTQTTTFVALMSQPFHIMMSLTQLTKIHEIISASLCLLRDVSREFAASRAGRNLH